MESLLGVLAMGAGAAAGSQATLRLICQRQPRPLPHHLAFLLEHPLRRLYRQPGETLGLYGFTGGMHVLDLGCGVGTFTVEMARMVGPTGVVHAVDIQRAMLNRVEERAAAEELHARLRFHHSSAYELPLPDASIDLAVLIAVLGEIPDPVRALREVRRVLRPGGRIAVSEELLFAGYAPPKAVRSWLAEAGFRFGAKSGTPACYHTIAYS
jgi:ubiquinone/menaquinone biosynthesis C-methylase UbiE